MALHVIRYLLVTLAIGVGVARAAPIDEFQLIKNDVVVFLGGTNMLHLQRAGYLEAILTQAYSEARPTFRDLSWEADTVFQQGTAIERWRAKAHFDDDEGLGDLTAQLDRLEATVVIAQFGQLESLAGEESLADFRQAYSTFLDKLRGESRRIVVLSPTPFGKTSNVHLPAPSRRNTVLASFVNATKQLATKHNVRFVDLFTSGPRDVTTEDGMHIKQDAQSLIAAVVAERLGLPDVHPAEKLRLAIIEKHRLWYDYWRPANWKLLFGDDARRQFTRGDVPFREEWKQLRPMIARAEERIWKLAHGGDAPIHERPKPEVLHADPAADVDMELASFSVPDGFEVNLFASETEGLTSPLNLRWDPAGRMYVSVTTTYPHVLPGDLPNDKIICLEDTDHDGKADRSTVFAEGLNIPTGIEWGNGGVYVGQNTEILFLKDNDNDGQADERRVLLSGFGNGDSHQTINSFAWSLDGQLYFGHGDGCESRVETPWGASHLFNAGYYRLEPNRLKLVPFLEGHMGPGNPWGVGFDHWGQIFGVDGAGGVSWLSPGQVSTTHRRRFPRLGKPGGYCGIGYLDGRGLPDSMQGDFVIGDYKPNQVSRFSLAEDGTGFNLTWEEPVLKSRHRNFRPVDVKVGPDGAIYVVDWYNLITCHQDDAYRDPRRDKAHGRIWRVAAVASSDAREFRPPNLLEAPIDDVLNALRSPEYWTRYQAKRALTAREPELVTRSLDDWVRTLNPRDAQYEQHLVQALGAYATLESVAPNLLKRLLRASDPRARAFATRIVGRWHDRLDDPLALLAQSIADEHPRVRMEAIVASSSIHVPKSMSVVAAAVDQPMDSWSEYAFKQALQRLKPSWLPAFHRGEVSLPTPNQLAAVLNEIGDQDAIESLRRLVNNDSLDGEAKVSAISAILAVGGADDLRRYGLDPERFTRDGTHDAELHASVLARLVEIAGSREIRPSGDLAEDLRVLMKMADKNMRSSATALAGLWSVEELRGDLISWARNDEADHLVRRAAFAALSRTQSAEGRELLLAYATRLESPTLRAAAIQSLARLDVNAAAKAAARHFNSTTNADHDELLLALLNRQGGANALATALRGESLAPEAAKSLLRSLFASGRSDAQLFDVLNRTLGAIAKPPQYSAGLVRQLANSAATHGTAGRGAVIFQSLACVSCHKVGGNGGDVGPDLTALGTTLSSERIIEELLWPNRQIKEGFATVVVLTRDGKVHTGYERATRQSAASGDLVLQDVASKEFVTIKKRDIEDKRIAASAMPEGVTAVLAEDQLLHLIKYLTELGRIP